MVLMLRHTLGFMCMQALPTQPVEPCPGDRDEPDPAAEETIMDLRLQLIRCRCTGLTASCTPELSVFKDCASCGSCMLRRAV